MNNQTQKPQPNQNNKPKKMDVETRRTWITRGAFGVAAAAIILFSRCPPKTECIQKTCEPKTKIEYVERCSDAGVVALPPDAEIVKPVTQAVVKPKKAVRRRSRPARRTGVRQSSGKCAQYRGKKNSDSNAFASVTAKIQDKIAVSFEEAIEGKVEVIIKACKIDTPGSSKYKLSVVSLTGIKSGSLQMAKKAINAILRNGKPMSLKTELDQSVKNYKVTF